MNAGLKKTWNPWLPVSDSHVILWLLVLNQYKRVTNGWTDRQATYACVAL